MVVAGDVTPVTMLPSGGGAVAPGRVVVVVVVVVLVVVVVVLVVGAAISGTSAVTTNSNRASDRGATENVWSTSASPPGSDVSCERTLPETASDEIATMPTVSAAPHARARPAHGRGRCSTIVSWSAIRSKPSRS